MTTIDPARASGDDLDRLVAAVRGIPLLASEDGRPWYQPGHKLPPRRWNPSGFWSQGGPIIEETHIDLNWDQEGDGQWSASIDPDILVTGATLLEAAMRAYILAKQRSAT
jgi:hypothetical protein